MKKFKKSIGLDPKDIQVVLFHNPCPDGWGSAGIANWFRSKKIKFIPVNIRDLVDLSVVTGKNVLMVDIVSPNFKKIKEVAANLVILDHHETNQKKLEGIPYAFFNNEKSGVGLAWEFFSDEPLPFFLACIQDRDLWAWKIEESRFFCDGLQTILDFNDRKFTIFNELMENEDKFDELYNLGELVNYLKKKQINLIAPITKPEKNRIEIIINEVTYICYIYNLTQYDLISELGSHVAENFECHFVIIWRYDHDRKTYFYSLRSAAEKTNVGEIAALFGGGGHKGAASMISKEHPDILFCL